MLSFSNIYSLNNTRWYFLVWVLTAVVFIADLLLPPDYNIVFTYLLAHFLAIFFKNKNDVLFLAVVTTTLTIIGIVLKPLAMPLEDALLSRLFPIISFWAAAFFVIQFIALREEELKQKGMFETLFQYATNGMLVSNQEGRIVMANPALEKLFGYKKGELDGQHVEILIPIRHAAHHIEHRDKYNEAPHARSMGTGLQLHGLKQDGSEFPIEVSLSPFNTREGTFVMAFVVDNTFRKNYENSILQQKQELATLTTALQTANEDLEAKVTIRTAELEQAKNEVTASLEKERELGALKSGFVSMASHEFRTPLSAVMSSADLIQQYVARQDFENINKHATRIQQSVKNLNGILTEFLSLGRLEEGRVAANLEEVDLKTCITEVQEAMQHLFKNGQKFEYRQEGSTEAFLDKNLIRNILINLISNAIKYSPENGHIVVTTTFSDRSKRVSVQDNGIGIPEQEQKHLFDRFFRASNATNSTQGTGLGLYIVQRYASMMNGTVGFDSTEGEGSVFWVEF